MTEREHKTIEQAEQEGKYIRKVRSFVKREGRLTKGQARALETYWDVMGLEHGQGLIDAQEVFGNDNPVVLEIGFGMGKSLVEMAKNAPELNFIGIEVHRPGVGACILTAKEEVEESIDNLRVYEHDAIEILADCIPDGSLTTVQLFFPDPWHKKKHHKRRIVQPEFIETIRYAAALHDVGKISIPETILHKPGKLDPEEWEIMKTHAQKGYELLADSNRIVAKMGAIIAKTHHERWDGKGYPEGLKGDDIPVEGRIMAIVDVVDALLSKRCYKPAWSEEEVKAYLQENAGTQFDPIITHVMLEHFDKIQDIRAQAPDED